MKFSDIKSIKILFEPTKRVCFIKRLNNTSRNKPTWKNTYICNIYVKIYEIYFRKKLYN